MFFPRLHARNTNRKWTSASRWLAGLPLILLLFGAQRKQVFLKENFMSGRGQTSRRGSGSGFRPRAPEVDFASLLKIEAAFPSFFRNPYNRRTSADHDAVQQGQ